MLHAVPHCAFPPTYDVLLDLEKVGQVEWGYILESGEIRIGESTCQVRLCSARDGSYSFVCDGRILAIAKQRSSFVRECDVDADGHLLQLRGVSFWNSEIAVFENGQQIGRIAPDKILSHRVIIDLPDEIPLPLQLLVFWLANLLERNGFWIGTCLEALASLS
jgi:hypothetical protein